MKSFMPEIVVADGSFRYRPTWKLRMDIRVTSCKESILHVCYRYIIIFVTLVLILNIMFYRYDLFMGNYWVNSKKSYLIHCEK